MNFLAHESCAGPVIADGSVLMYVLDTNVISELRKGKKGERGVRMGAQALPTASLYLSAVSALELEIGTLLVERRDQKQGAILRAWIDGHVAATAHVHGMTVVTRNAGDFQATGVVVVNPWH